MLRRIVNDFVYAYLSPLNNILPILILMTRAAITPLSPVEYSINVSLSNIQLMSDLSESINLSYVGCHPDKVRPGAIIAVFCHRLTAVCPRDSMRAQ